MGIIDREIDASGLITDIGFEDGKMKVRYTQNTGYAHGLNQQLRNSDEYTQAGIKANLWNVVRLTEADCMKLIVEDGINPYTASAKELRKHLSRNRDKWGHVLTTRGQF